MVGKLKLKRLTQNMWVNQWMLLFSLILMPYFTVYAYMDVAEFLSSVSAIDSSMQPDDIWFKFLAKLTTLILAFGFSKPDV